MLPRQPDSRRPDTKQASPSAAATAPDHSPYLHLHHILLLPNSHAASPPAMAMRSQWAGRLPTDVHAEGLIPALSADSPENDHFYRLC